MYILKECFIQQNTSHAGDDNNDISSVERLRLYLQNMLEHTANNIPGLSTCHGIKYIKNKTLKNKPSWNQLSSAKVQVKK